MAEEKTNVVTIEGWEISEPSYSRSFVMDYGTVVEARMGRRLLTAQKGEIEVQIECDCRPWMGGGCCGMSTYVPVAVLVEVMRRMGFTLNKEQPNAQDKAEAKP